jgi:hypothetical protein
MTDRESTLLLGREKRIEQILGRPLAATIVTNSPPIQSSERRHMLESAEELYWNELEWEKITGEERLDAEFLTELAFPGLLAFVRGLLLSEVMPDSLSEARPSPEVVRDILSFLAGRVVELDEQTAGGEAEEGEQREAELKMTSRLVDLILYLIHDLPPEEVEAVEAAIASG